MAQGVLKPEKIYATEDNAAIKVCFVVCGGDKKGTRLGVVYEKGDMFYDKWLSFLEEKIKYNSHGKRR